MNRKRLRIALVLVTMGVVLPGGTEALAAQFGFGLQASNFQPSDGSTEDLFELDSGPIPQIFFRAQMNAHALLVGIGYQSWEREDISVTSSIDFFPVFASYRFLPWHRKPVSLVIGGGLGLLGYGADIEERRRFATEFETQGGLMMSLEPVVGVEFRAGSHVRFNLDVKHSLQIFSSEDFADDALVVGGADIEDIDMSGTYATLGMSFLFGN
jgi:hypothetical protein